MVAEMACYTMLGWQGEQAMNVAAIRVPAASHSPQIRPDCDISIAS